MANRFTLHPKPYYREKAPKGLIDVDRICGLGFRGLGVQGRYSSLSTQTEINARTLRWSVVKSFLGYIGFRVRINENDMEKKREC